MKQRFGSVGQRTNPVYAKPANVGFCVLIVGLCAMFGSVAIPSQTNGSKTT